MKLRLTINTFIFCLIIAVQVFAWEGRVVRVLDGDTVEVLNSQNQTTRVRLYGIDTPEKSQDFGQKAKQFTLSLVGSKTVDVEAIDTDRYGRTVGVITLGNTVLNAEILKAGYAWYYAQYCKKDFCGEWQQLESQARSSKIGLWSISNPQPPWDFRKYQKKSNTNANTATIKQDISESGEYHGNTGSKKFHQKSCQHFNCKNCTTIFNSRQKALDAGYDPCGLCKP